ncbi:MAG: membrane protein insertase YidC [Clostridia bacterium]|nr:membrane protein insertase YidC [Clostridia bacterium]
MGIIFDWIAIPLAWLMKVIYGWIPNYFVTIFLFTLLMRLLMFPLSLKSQKMQADRARLAPRLERLQKKYAQDPKKLQEKQMALYEKEGVSMTGGCLPMLTQMVVLFGIISVIYSPVKHLTDVPDAVVSAAANAVSYNDVVLDEKNKDDYSADQIAAEQAKKNAGKVAVSKMKGYYKELYTLNNVEKFADEVKTSITAMEGYDEVKAQAYIDEMVALKKQFTIGSMSLLENPGTGGFGGISWLWLIPLISGLTALASSFITMQFQKAITSSEVKQPGQGCSNGMMMYMMPLFSLWISFSVPGGVGIYWICSNVIATVQSVILNKIYNPAKIRAQAEVEYEEKRRQKQEDKKRLAEARAREQRALAAELNEQKGKSDNKKKQTKKTVEEAAEPVSDDAEEKG